MATLWAGTQRQQDLVTFKDAYRAQAGNLVGAQDAFDRRYTPESYYKQGIYNSLDPNSNTWGQIRRYMGADGKLPEGIKKQLDGLGSGMGDYVERMLQQKIDPQRPY